MKILLINPPDHIVADPKWDEPLGLLYIAANTEVECDVVDFNITPNWKGYLRDHADYDIIGITCLSLSLNTVIEMTKFISVINPNTFLVAGGAHATAQPYDLIPYFDVVISGDGERVFNTVIRHGKFLTNHIITDIEPITNIDQYKFPARNLINIHDYHRTIDGRKSTGLVTSRGCPYRCIFCCTGRQRTRFRSPENVLAEIDECVEKYDITAFSIRDDTFTLDTMRLTKLLFGFKLRDIVWRCLTRTDRVNNHKLYDMKHAGCREIIYGIESGSQKILDNIQKGTTVQQNANAIDLARKHGIPTKIGLMVGCPGESPETVMETIRFVKAHPPDKILLSAFTPIPGSPIWEDPDKYGVKLLDRDFTNYQLLGAGMMSKVVTEVEGMNREQISDARDYMIAEFKRMGLIE